MTMTLWSSCLCLLKDQVTDVHHSRFCGSGAQGLRVLRSTLPPLVGWPLTAARTPSCKEQQSLRTLGELLSFWRLRGEGGSSRSPLDSYSYGGEDKTELHETFSKKQNKNNSKFLLDTVFHWALLPGVRHNMFKENFREEKKNLDVPLVSCKKRVSIPREQDPWSSAYTKTQEQGHY